MDKSEVFNLLFILILEYTIFSPLVQYFIELGLNIEMTVGGVTAPTREFMSPMILSLLGSMWFIIDIFGTVVTISAFYKRLL